MEITFFLVIPVKNLMTDTMVSGYKSHVQDNFPSRTRIWYFVLLMQFVISYLSYIYHIIRQGLILFLSNYYCFLFLR